MAFDDVSIAGRWESTVTGYSWYLQQSAWLFSLGILYPLPVAGFSPTQVAASALLLVGITVLALFLLPGAALPF